MKIFREKLVDGKWQMVAEDAQDVALGTPTGPGPENPWLRIWGRGIRRPKLFERRDAVSVRDLSG